MTTATITTAARTASVIASCKAAVSALTAAARHLTDGGLVHLAAACEATRRSVAVHQQSHETAAAQPTPTPKTATVVAPSAPQAVAPKMVATPATAIKATIPSDTELAMKGTGLLAVICRTHGVPTLDAKGNQLSGAKMRLALSAARSQKPTPVAVPAPIAKPAPTVTTPATVAAVVNVVSATMPALDNLSAADRYAALSAACKAAGLPDGGTEDRLTARLKAVGAKPSPIAPNGDVVCPTMSAALDAAYEATVRQLSAPIAAPSTVARCQSSKANGTPCGSIPMIGSQFCRHHGKSAAQSPAANASKLTADMIAGMSREQLVTIIATMPVETVRLMVQATL